jgi:putative transposase
MASTAETGQQAWTETAEDSVSPREVFSRAASDDPDRVREREAAASRGKTVLVGGVEIDDDLIDKAAAELLASGGPARLTGAGGFLPGLVKAVLERGLAAELTEHLGYEKGDPAGAGSGNSRNGATPKTVRTEVGQVGLDVPRDRQGTFSPLLVPKGQRHLDGLTGMITSLYAGGMTVRDIERHLYSTLGVDVPPATISAITDAMLTEVRTWQTRPLDPVWPIIYVDALVVKVRDGNVVTNKAAHLVVGVDLDGVKHVLGIWVQNHEGARFWAQVLTDLRNRGVRDVLIACCDGLSGLPQAIASVWPATVTQTCVVHLIRASMRFVSYGDRRAVAAALKPVYTAVNAETAQEALLEFAESDLGKRYKACVATWENAWEDFVPFMAFPPAVRKIIYTTNAIESLNFQIRKIIKNRGHFPSDDAVVKLIWLAIMDIEDRRAFQRDRERGKPRGKNTAPPKMIEGQQTQGWTQALNALSLAYPGRIPTYAT